MVFRRQNLHQASSEATDTRAMLDQLIAERRETYADLSRLLNRNPAYIQQFIKRGTPRKLDEEDRRTLARYFGVADDTLGGHAVSSDRSLQAQSVPANVVVKRLALGASAGAGSLDEDERPISAMAFDANLLRRLRVRPHRVSIIRVDGDSMMPTLGDGDDIMVDHDDAADRLRDGIYVVRLDGLMMVKRVALGPRRRSFSILSDNTLYPDWAEVDPVTVHVVGRVVWTGKGLPR